LRGPICPLALLADEVSAKLIHHRRKNHGQYQLWQRRTGIADHIETGRAGEAGMGVDGRIALTALRSCLPPRRKKEASDVRDNRKIPFASGTVRHAGPERTRER
jgi:hypothetical protein